MVVSDPLQSVLWLEAAIFFVPEYCGELSNPVQSCEGSRKVIARHGCQ
jgi:hypothetical protein